MELNIGISSDDREAIASGLARLLADSYTLYMKTQNYHWNVEGPMFNTLHLMFEGHYTELATAVDEMASVEEAKGGESAEEMIRQLVIGQETVARTAREIFPAAEKASDEPTADLLTQRIQSHEKNAWMLRSMLA